MTTRSNTPSRRSALQLFGASAALATPGIGLAADAASPAAAGPRSLLTLANVPLAWPLYHRTAGGGDPVPERGARVFLERDTAHPSGERGIAVYRKSGEQLGFVTDRHHAALDWALKRSDRVEARIVAVDEPVVRARRVPGWGAFRISVDAYEGAASA